MNGVLEANSWMVVPSTTMTNWGGAEAYFSGALAVSASACTGPASSSASV